MTTEQLHEILDDPNRKLTTDQIAEVINQLKNDAFNEQYKLTVIEGKHTDWRISFYTGEMNAFQLCIDLLEHFDENYYPRLFFERMKSRINTLMFVDCNTEEGFRRFIEELEKHYLESETSNDNN